MSTAPVTVKRHALGLPAGSVRSLHALLVVGLICAVLLIPMEPPAPVPPYLLYLLFIILGSFFAAHGTSIGTAESSGSPLHLPRGAIRLLIILALAGAVGWKIYSDPTGLEQQYNATIEELKKQPLLPLYILGGFFIGVLFRMIVGRGEQAQLYQDLKAWTSILALVGLGIAVIIHSVINPSLESPVSMPAWEGILGGIIAFYFGERS
jgi:hypothetical protein